jgi:two-component system OmpR family response regulator
LGVPTRLALRKFVKKLFQVVTECNRDIGWNSFERRGQYIRYPMATHRHVLICDEERESRSALAPHLERDGYRVTVTGRGALTRAMERARIDVVILGLQVGDEDALRICRNLRAGSDVPLVILAARADDVDRIVALEMGADDYLVKPVNPREIAARLRNILRRSGNAGTPATRARWFRFGGWQLDSVARQLSDASGHPVSLRNAEYRVLASLLAHGNRVVSRLKLIELARGRDALPFDRSIDVRISRLRHILGDDARLPRIIKTVHGEGYVIGVPVERS